DHGKSTLADRMLELTGTVEKRKMREQVLDAMDLERERGITIKMQPVRMVYHPDRPELAEGPYTLNLIDTPGHIDFAYEVSRALTAVEGVVLLVDATQGIQAQTLTTLEKAKEAGCTIIPAVSKVDSPLARVPDAVAELATLLDVPEESVLLVSGKTGEGVDGLLRAIIERIPAPATGDPRPGGRALIFDFSYSEHRGIVAYIRVTDGVIRPKDSLFLVAVGKRFVPLEVGWFKPEETPADALHTGEIGYVVSGIKEPGVALVGDTVVSRDQSFPALPGYQLPRPVVWASLYPESQGEFTALKQALLRLKLSDAALSFDEEGSSILGKGFRCGFLGMLHLEIVTERLKREFGLAPVITMPSIAYEVVKKGDASSVVYSASQFPDESSVEAVREQVVRVSIITPPGHLSAVTQLLYDHEAVIESTNLFSEARQADARQLDLRALPVID
ncbi:MAG: GTP-binding protein, partial [Patescibacteria group bacterium]